MSLATILWALIGGTVVGFLGKWLAPGKRDIALWLTILCGIGGVLLGNYLYVEVFDFDPSTPRLDWWRHIWQIAVAAVLVVGAAALNARRRRR
jgi:uncharacterized membrane protein YeaQ/YmgE (transglycosylase-associated protein family)